MIYDASKLDFQDNFNKPQAGSSPLQPHHLTLPQSHVMNSFIETQAIASTRPKHPTAFTRIYPTQKILTVKFESSQQITVFLINNAREIGYCKWQLFGKSIHDEGYYLKIAYTCRVSCCPSELVFKQRKTSQAAAHDGHQKKYYLAPIRIVNEHSHRLKLTAWIAGQQQIRQHLFDLPQEQKLDSYLQVAKEKFRLTDSKAYYLKHRVFWKFKDEDDMLRRLSEYKITFRRKIYHQDQKNPDSSQYMPRSSILLLASDTMRSNYHQYGDMLCFDITYKLLMRKKGDERSIGVGFFVGQDENSRVVLFGMATIRHESSDNFVTLFEFFFEIMGYVPRTILTDDQLALGYALDRLKAMRNYGYCHLLDWYHKMQACKRMLRKQPNRQQLMTLFCRLLKQPSKKAYHDILLEIATLLANQSPIQHFLKDSSKCCLSQVPGTFFGFGISSSRAEAFHSLVKMSVPHQTNIGRLVYFLTRVQRRLLSRMSALNPIHPSLTQHLSHPQLLLLSSRLQHRPFQQLRQHHEHSRSYPHPVPLSPIQLRLQYTQYGRPYHCTLTYSISHACWQCDCMHVLRTGLPCGHLMRVVGGYGGCLGYYVSERWLHGKSGAGTASRPSLKNKGI